MFTRERSKIVDQPVLILGLEGWVDANLGGAAAVATLLGNMETEVLASFDIDVLLDFRSRRPTQRIEEGMLTSLTWPELQLRAGVDAQGNDVLLLVGPEPDHQWRAFTSAVVGLASEFDVRMAIGLGAFPAAVPHTRATRVVTTATHKDIAAKIGYLPAIREVPSGVNASLIKGFELAGVPAANLWAMVPHYLSGVPYPAASVSLLEALSSVSGVSVDTSELTTAANMTRARLDELIAQNPEHVEMVSSLEAQFDSATDANEGLNLDNLPSGDEIAAELERFLRDEGQR